MSRLMSTIVKANARYFIKQGWEPPELLGRLDRWLSDREDTALGKKVASWFLSDAQWSQEILPAMVRRFWYVAPVVVLIATRMRRQLLVWAKEAMNGRHLG